MTRRDSRAIEKTAALWLVKQDRDDWRAAEQEQLEAWLHEDTAHRVAFLRLLTAWQSSAVRQALRSQSGIDSERGISQFLDCHASTR
jgi:ferric-dicitrate binding protein FerR (iron transport regulator)